MPGHGHPARVRMGVRGGNPHDHKSFSRLRKLCLDSAPDYADSIAYHTWPDHRADHTRPNDAGPDDTGANHAASGRHLANGGHDRAQPGDNHHRDEQRRRRLHDQC